MQVKNIKYILFGLIIIILAIFVYLMVSDKIIIPQKIIPKEIIRVIKSEILTEEKDMMENISIKKPAHFVSSGSSGSSAGGSQSAAGLTNVVSNIESCPLMISIKYLVDHKGTKDAADDDVYINLKNSKSGSEYISLEVDNAPEGSLEIVGLGSSEIKSNIITSWWKSRTISETKTFDLLITPNSCAPFSDELIVSYPLSLEAYLD